MYILHESNEHRNAIFKIIYWILNNSKMNFCMLLYTVCCSDSLDVAVLFFSDLFLFRVSANSKIWGHFKVELLWASMHGTYLSNKNLPNLLQKKIKHKNLNISGLWILTWFFLSVHELSNMKKEKHFQ